MSEYSFYAKKTISAQEREICEKILSAMDSDKNIKAFVEEISAGEPIKNLRDLTKVWKEVEECLPKAEVQAVVKETTAVKEVSKPKTVPLDVAFDEPLIRPVKERDYNIQQVFAGDQGGVDIPPVRDQEPVNNPGVEIDIPEPLMQDNPGVDVEDPFDRPSFGDEPLGGGDPYTTGGEPGADDPGAGTGGLGGGNLKDLPPNQKRKAAAQTADMFLDAYFQYVPIPFKNWAKVSQYKYDKAVFEGRIDPTMHVADGVTVDEHIKGFNAQVDETFKEKKEDRENIREPLIEVLLEQNLALTATQRLLFAVGMHVASMGFAAYQLASVQKMMLQTFEKFQAQKNEPGGNGSEFEQPADNAQTHHSQQTRQSDVQEFLKQHGDSFKNPPPPPDEEFIRNDPDPNEKISNKPPYTSVPKAEDDSDVFPEEKKPENKGKKPKPLDKFDEKLADQQIKE